METPRAPSPFRGLAVALLLGVVLAAAAVGFLAVPSSIQLTGAAQGTTSTNQSKVNQGGQVGTMTPTTGNVTSGANATLVTNSTEYSFVSVNDFVAAISSGQTAGTPNSSVSGNTAGNLSSPSNTYILSSQQKSDVVASEWRDLMIFAAAGALALVAFLLSRRQMS